MILYIQNTDIIELLGLNMLPEEEQETAFEDFQISLLSNFINRIENDKSLNLPSDILDILKNTNEDIPDITKTLQAYPNLAQAYIEEEYNLKKNVLTDQLKDFKEVLEKSGNQSEEISKIINSIDELLNIVSSNDQNNEFEHKYLEYQKLVKLKQ